MIQGQFGSLKGNSVEYYCYIYIVILSSFTTVWLIVTTSEYLQFWLVRRLHLWRFAVDIIQTNGVKIRQLVGMETNLCCLSGKLCSKSDSFDVFMSLMC